MNQHKERMFVTKTFEYDENQELSYKDLRKLPIGTEVLFWAMDDLQIGKIITHDDKKIEGENLVIGSKNVTSIKRPKDTYTNVYLVNCINIE